MLKKILMVSMVMLLTTSAGYSSDTKAVGEMTEGCTACDAISSKRDVKKLEQCADGTEPPCEKESTSTRKTNTK